MSTKLLFLSHVLDEKTPTYGNRNAFLLEKKSSIARGDVANDSHISTTVHVGTHIDMPYHFHKEGQTIEDYDADFWYFTKPAFVDLAPLKMVIHDELITAIEERGFSPETDILIVRTGIEKYRNTDRFWQANPGFSPAIYDYLVGKFPKLRILGFDSISVSSFADRPTGREAHMRFLNPHRPILLLEDMKLAHLERNAELEEVVVSPLRIAQCDGLPCTVLAMFKES